jgi:hypothetical protein
VKFEQISQGKVRKTSDTTAAQNGGMLNFSEDTARYKRISMFYSLKKVVILNFLYRRLRPLALSISEARDPRAKLEAAALH